MKIDKSVDMTELVLQGSQLCPIFREKMGWYIRRGKVNYDIWWLRQHLDRIFGVEKVEEYIDKQRMKEDEHVHTGHGDEENKESNI